MKKFRFFLHPLIIFIVAQLAWISVVGLWIYWYVSNYMIINKVGDRFAPQFITKKINILSLVGGLILLAAVLVGMYLIFIYLNRQLNITRLYDNFIANVTHELKSPLASIQLYLETMKMRDVPQSKQQEFITLMIKDANRLKSLINTILEISGLERKAIAYNFHVYDAESLLRSIFEESADQFKLPAGSFCIHGSARCECVADRNALKIVIDNLVDNAIKYSKNPVHIDIFLYCKKNTFGIEFKDEGVGITASEHRKIFRKFHRIYSPEIPNVKGTGLGLYWVKEIVKFHGGKISVFSEGLNLGTMFKISLPIYQTTKRRYIKYLLNLTKKRERQKVANHEQK